MRRLVLWGHHLDEYRDMFHLSQTDLTKRILEYCCGATAVNFELQEVAARAVSCDPWFHLDKKTLAAEIDHFFQERLKGFKSDNPLLDFSRYGGLNELVRYRRAGIETFLGDYDQGRLDRRYVAVSDNALPFGQFEFDFALSANCLFDDIESQTVEYHLDVIHELARVAKEVRIFPLVDAKGFPSPLLGPVLLRLNQANYGVEVCDVSYRLQVKGNAMLRVWAQECKL